MPDNQVLTRLQAGHRAQRVDPMKAFVVEYMVELAGIGKIALEESPKVAAAVVDSSTRREFLNAHPKAGLKSELLIHKIKVDFLKEVKPKFDNIEKLVDAALAPVKGNTTAIGRAFQKHSTREGTAFFGDITGDILKNTEQGMNYLKEILECPLAQVILKNHDVYGGILDIRLPDGMGARWLNNGEKFIGFLERRTKDYHG